jgi:hypothetical protein
METVGPILLILLGLFLLFSSVPGLGFLVAIIGALLLAASRSR